MNFKRSEKYASIAFYAFVTVCASSLVVLAVFNLSYVFGFINKVISVLTPFICGFIIAYLCNPIMIFYEENLFAFKKSKKSKAKLRRSLSLALSMLTILLILTILVYAVLPQIIASYEDLGAQLNSYIENIQKFADNLMRENSLKLLGTQYDTFSEFLSAYDITFSLKSILTSSYSFIQSSLDSVIDYSGRFVGGVTSFVLGIILAVYFLYSKEKICAQIKKSIYAIFSRRTYLNTVRLMRYTHKTFGGFIIGKLLDSLIIGLLTFIVLWICKIPYYPLIAVIVGITNIIPYFGPIIGAIPSIFIIFIASPTKALWFIIIIIIIQQLDGNIIGPKILGDSIGIDAMWIVIAITVAGGFFGFAGMILGVPATAVIYVLFKQHVEKKLRHKNVPSSTAFYKNDPPIENIIDPALVLIDKSTPVPDISVDSGKDINENKRG